MAEEKTLASALCAAQAKMENPKKDKTATVRTKSGGEYAYNYCTLDAVLDIVRPALNEEGIYLFQASSQVESKMLLHTVVMGYGETLELDVTPYQYMTDPQDFGKRETYARRYSLLKAFGLAGDDDTDGDTGPDESDGKPPAEAEGSVHRQCEEIARLKGEAIKAGASKEGIEAWYESQFGSKPLNDLTNDQRAFVMDEMTRLVIGGDEG